MKEDRRLFWAQKFAEYRSALNGYLRRRVMHAEDAEDLAQEVYLRLLRVEDGERNTINNPEAYLYTVAVNLLRERAVQLRRKGQHVDLLDVEEELVAGDGAPEEGLQKRERERRLAGVVNELSPKFRAAIVMHYYRGMTPQEIADVVGGTPHAIKKSIVRALVVCRRKMKKFK